MSGWYVRMKCPNCNYGDWGIPRRTLPPEVETRLREVHLSTAFSFEERSEKLRSILLAWWLDGSGQFMEPDYVAPVDPTAEIPDTGPCADGQMYVAIKETPGE